MSAKNTEIRLQAGADMSRSALILAASRVSSWLTDAPYTLDKTPDQILADAVEDEAYYMTRGGEVLGYFALRSFREPVNATTNDGLVRMYWKVPHYGIQSLVVSPHERGNGLGDRLVAEAFMVAGGRTIESAPGAAMSLISAVATASSMKVFRRQDFAVNNQPSVMKAHGYRIGGLDAGKTIVSKVVQVSSRQPAMAVRLLN